MENLKNMKQILTSLAQGQMANLDRVDANELGAVVDMIKDLEEAIYYCAVTKAMKENENRQVYYYAERGNNNNGNGNGNNSYNGNGNNGGNRYYREREIYPQEIRDYREGRSPLTRKMYMEAKENRHDKATKMHDLEKYMQDLANDLTEMIEGATAEEKQILHNKLLNLSNAI